MKEKLKKVFTNKEFWTALIGCLGLLLSIALSYFSGFKDGILIDNSIRTELIEKVVDDAKNNKIDVQKKSLIDNGNNTYICTYNDYVSLGTGLSNDDVSLFDVGYIVQCSYNIYYDNYNYTDTFLVNYCEYSLILYQTIYNVNTFTTNHFFIDANGELTTFRSQAFAPTIRETFNTEYNAFAYSPLLMFANTGDLTDTYQISAGYVNGQFRYVNEELLYSDFYYSMAVSWLNTLFNYGTYSFATNDIIRYIMGLGVTTNPVNYPIVTIQHFQNLFDVFDLYHGGASDEELEQAYDNGYNSGYDIGRTEGFDIGYQAREDSVEDTTQRLDSIWTILEKGITSVLNVLNFEILPGIPLFICIAVPLLLAIIGIFIKMGQS